MKTGKAFSEKIVTMEKWTLCHLKTGPGRDVASLRYQHYGKHSLIDKVYQSILAYRKGPEIGHRWQKAGLLRS
ncbi:hypothetical protein [Paraburkholderia sp. BCC1884]|uniref:hypothetical protein n=1 Tax=Paraburkholderia sp. BCC1884 TaxID=2562668 RepID=UPI001182EC10|nr:hypothetical protein [Paraburkholderia sp. BCC1884]